MSYFTDRRVVDFGCLRTSLSTWLSTVCLMLLGAVANAACPAQNLVVRSGGTVTRDVSACAPWGSASYLQVPQHGPADPRNEQFSTTAYYTNDGLGAPTDSFILLNARDGSDIQFNVTVIQVVAITPAAVPDPAVGVAYSQPLSANGGTPPYTWRVTSGSLPTGLTLSSAGVLSGVPTVAGGFSFTITSTDSSTGIRSPVQGSRAYTLTVSASRPGSPTGVTARTVAGDAGATATATATATVSFSAPASNGGSPITQYTVTSTPDGMTATGTGSAIIVTGLRFGTEYRFSVTASNAAGTGSASVESNPVTPTRQQVITLQNPGSLAYGTTTPLSVSSTSGLPVTVTSSTSTCEIVATQQVRALTPGSCTLHASQQGGAGFEPATPVQQSFPIIVPGGAVTINTVALPAPQLGVRYAHPIVASGGVQPYTYQRVGMLPNGLSLNDGVLSGVATHSGTYSFTVTVTDAASQSASQNYSVTVGDRAPVAEDEAANILSVPEVIEHKVTVQAGKPVSINVAQGAANGPFTAAAVITSPSTGTVQVRGTELIYTPGEDATGDIAFTYTLSNASGVSLPATVTVMVNPMPVAPAFLATVQAGHTLRIAVSEGARGAPFTGAAIVSVMQANAGHARIERAAEGYVLIFDAATGFSGVTQIGYVVSNAYTTSAIGIVSITVSARPDPSKDADVLGVLSAQADATRRMATGQIGNFHHRLEQLHNGPSPAGFSNGITLSSARASRRTLADRGSREHVNGPSASGAMGETDGSRRGEARKVVEAGQATHLLPEGTSVWTSGGVNFGGTDSVRGDTSTDFTTAGLSMGADKQFAEGLILGTGVGYGRDDTNVGTQVSRSHVDSYSVAVYLSYRPHDALFVDSLVGHQWLSLDTVRSVADVGRPVIGSRDGRQWFGSMAVGYMFRTKALQIAPYGRFDAAHASLGSFTERGDALYALNYRTQTVKTSTLSAGVLAHFAFQRDYGTWAPQFRVEYGRDLEGASNALLSYADLMGGSVYRASLLQRSRGQTLLGSGLALQTIRGWHLSLEYMIQRVSGASDEQSVRFGLEKKIEP